MKRNTSSEKPSDEATPSEGGEGVRIPPEERGAGREGDLNRPGEEGGDQGGGAGAGQVRPYQEVPRNPMDHGGIAD
jgi:hypothetical protein